MRALVDRHQADLLYALQILFEDKLDIELYVPIGYEWFDEGYWQFGHEHLGRALADQYLNIDGKYTAVDDGNGGYWQTFDPAHPDREIRCITLPEFRALDWTHIVATVQDNQAGFHRLAQEVGASYVYQIGNTRQQADWSLDPLAIVSSEVPIEGRGVRMHQPFDHLTTFRYRDPDATTATLTSFVNLFSRFVPPDHDEYPVWQAIAGLLPEFATRSYGIDCPDGNLHPVAAIADEMANAAFGVHLKPTGDGFGHVLHNWAAVGRPLIGRGRYYAGQMGERFWRDGETCIDLDLRSPAESAALIRDIYNDRPRHQAMCQAIRAEFDRIDWDAEAREIAALLL